MPDIKKLALDTLKVLAKDEKHSAPQRYEWSDSAEDGTGLPMSNPNVRGPAMLSCL